MFVNIDELLLIEFTSGAITQKALQKETAHEIVTLAIFSSKHHIRRAIREFLVKKKTNLDQTRRHRATGLTLFGVFRVRFEHGDFYGVSRAVKNNGENKWRN